jgi:hypothetical protein
MQLSSIFQDPIAGSDEFVTTAVITEVASHCILARQLIDGLGKPPIHSDMEMLGSDGTWTIVWTRPQLTLAAATALLHQVLSTPRRIRHHAPHAKNGVAESKYGSI